MVDQRAARCKRRRAASSHHARVTELLVGFYKVGSGRPSISWLEAFEARSAERSGRYSYEQRPATLVAPYSGMLGRDARAREFFEAQVPSYRRAATLVKKPGGESPAVAFSLVSDA
jgi:hypothetical protein